MGESYRPFPVNRDPEIEFICDKRRHLVCIPYTIPNLHKMAMVLGINPRWFHRDHYDIPKRRVAEITAKCVCVPSWRIVEIIKKRE
jgi:hypothetical protein